MTFQPLPSALLRTLEGYRRRTRAPNTHRVYDAQWATFAAWCETHNQRPMLTDANVVAAYLASRAEQGSRVASLNVALSAIAFAHAAQGVAFDRSNPTLSLVLDGIRRAHVRPQQQAEPITSDLLRQILLAPSAGALEMRDAALLALLFTFALRASEAVALDWVQAGGGRGWIRTAPGYAEVGLLGSKSAIGASEVIAVPVNAIPSALQAIRTWVEHAGIQPGEALLRPVTKSGRIGGWRLQGGNVGGIVKRALARHLTRTGLPEEQANALSRRFSGHSGRVGFYISATEAGVSAQAIAAVARHGSLAMARRYARRADLLRCAPHATPGVGV